MRRVSPTPTRPRSRRLSPALRLRGFLRVLFRSALLLPGSWPPCGLRTRRWTIHRRGTSSNLSSSCTSFPPCEGVVVDLLIVRDRDLAWVPDRLRVFVSDLGQHRDLVLREAQLLHRRYPNVLGQAVEFLDASQGGLVRFEPPGIRSERLRDPGVALGRGGGVILTDRTEDAGRQGAVGTVVDAPCRLAHGVGGPRALRAVGHPPERRPVRHERAGLHVRPVPAGCPQPPRHVLDGRQGERVREGLVVIAGIALDPVRERVHPRRRRYGGRQPDRQGRVYERHVGADQGRAADVELYLALVVGDNGPERNLAAGPGRRGYRHERRDATRDRGLTVFVVGYGPAVDDLDADSLGRVHRTAAAEGHQPVATLLPVDFARPSDEFHVGVRPDPVEDGGVRKALEGLLCEACPDHAPVGYEQRTPHAQLLNDFPQPADGSGPVHHAGRDLDGAHGFDFDAHTASSFALCIWFSLVSSNVEADPRMKSGANLWKARRRGAR